MKRVYIEEIFEYKGYKCVCVFNAGCFRCGYVAVDNTHPYWGQWESNDGPNEIMCHCGLTYSGEGKHFYEGDDNLWWFGFDCGHFDDGIDCDTAKTYGVITDKEYLIQKEMMIVFNNNGHTIKDKEFVKENCKMIVEQLIAAKKKGG